MAEPVLELLDIRKQYGTLPVLRGVNLSIHVGEIVAIVGASGAGKSTLLHIAGTLDQPDSGRVMMNGLDTTQLSPKQLSRFRNKHIGFIFQFHHLLPEFTALENVCIPGWIAGQGKKTVELKAASLLERLGLADRINHKPDALSGGEQQRVAVARSLINDPIIVFADEPSGNLDSTHARDMHELFFNLRETMRQTFLIVTHNEELAGMSDRKMLMKDGLISQS